jgi:hypothetical protein
MTDVPREFQLDAKPLMELLRGFIFGNKETRLANAVNAAQIVKEANATVTSAAIFTIPGTDNMQQQFSVLIVVTDEVSGKGRYTTSGRQPTAAGAGAPLTSGGAFTTIFGNDAIRKFQLIAETGNTLNVWYGLYQ